MQTVAGFLYIRHITMNHDITLYHIAGSDWSEDAQHIRIKIVKKAVDGVIGTTGYGGIKSFNHHYIFHI